MSRLLLPSAGRIGLRQLAIRPQLQRRTLADAASSKFGPKYEIQRNIGGITAGQAIKTGTTLAYFGVAAGIFAFFFFAEVPKVRKDIVEKIPVLGDYFHVEIAPEDQWF